MTESVSSRRKQRDNFGIADGPDLLRFDWRIAFELILTWRKVQNTQHTSRHPVLWHTQELDRSEIRISSADKLNTSGPSQK